MAPVSASYHNVVSNKNINGAHEFHNWGCNISWFCLFNVRKSQTYQKVNSSSRMVGRSAWHTVLYVLNMDSLLFQIALSHPASLEEKRVAPCMGRSVTHGVCCRWKALCFLWSESCNQSVVNLKSFMNILLMICSSLTETKHLCVDWVTLLGL